MSTISLLELFTVFFKVGIIMFGGGYGAIGIYYKVLVEELQWINPEEFSQIISIASSVPGPIAINAAVYAGYKLKNIPGSILAVLGIVLPAYVVMFTAIMLLRPYIDHWVTKAILRGFNIAVLAIILYALVGLANSAFVKNGALDIAMIALFVVLFMIMYVLKPHPVILILCAGVVSLLLKILVQI
ncbi:MAG: chromate transporter [Desulfurococcaceae archaeon]